MPTTRPIPAELMVAFPGLQPRETVRLHPTPGSAPLDASKMGGEILWPEDERWPVCGEHMSVLVPVLQIRKDDVPELGFPADTDLYQLLWCPTFHREHTGPLSRTFWRRCRGILSVGPTPAPPGRFTSDLGEVDPWYLPQPCRLNPERVTELPSAFDLDPMLVEEIDEWLLGHLDQWFAEGRVAEPTTELVERFEGHPPPLYSWHFSVAPGTKIGGYVNWVQFSNWPRCERNHRMDHLLSVMNYESDPGDWLRWLPEEYEGESLAGASLMAVVVPSGMMDDDAVVSAHFVCRVCPEWPEAVDFQGT